MTHLGPWCIKTTGEDSLGNLDLWCDLAGAIQKECLPSSTRSSRRKYSPWISPELMKAAKLKRALFKKASRSNCPTGLQIAKDYQRSLKAVIYNVYQCHTARIAQKAKDDPKIFWSYMSRFRKTSQRPIFSSNGKIIDAPEEVAAHFASNFSSVYRTNTVQCLSQPGLNIPASSDASHLRTVSFSA